jgi:putative membrane protein
MQRFVERHVPAVTGVLTVVSLALVFAAALRVVPEGALPRAPDAVLAAIPHVNAAVSFVAFVVIAASWRWIRRGEVTRHRRGMLAGVVLFAVFLTLYLYRVALLGPTPFDGPAVVEQYVYYPILGVHVLLAVVCIPLLYYVLLLGLTRPVADLGATNHPKVGRIAAALWLTSFALGIVVYLLLYLF